MLALIALRFFLATAPGCAEERAYFDDLDAAGPMSECVAATLTMEALETAALRSQLTVGDDGSDFGL